MSAAKKKKRIRRISGQILKSLRFPWRFSCLRSISDHIFKKWLLTFYFHQCRPIWNHSVHKYIRASTNVPDIMRSIVMYKSQCWTPLVVHWLRVCLPMEGTRVQSLGWEHPTCCEATKPMNHNYWACAPQPEPTLMRSLHPTTREQPPSWQREKALLQQLRLICSQK